jgi:hypothetical protein
MRQASENGAGKHAGLAGARHGAIRRVARLTVLAFCALLLTAPGVVAGDRPDVSRSREARATKPNLRGNLPGPVTRQLFLAFNLAAERVSSNASCSALFTSLGADAIELLASVHFEGATQNMSGDTCSRGRVPAFTKVGGRHVRLCPPFALLSLPDAAVTVIHEALHCAGLSEKPPDPNGLTPQEINLMVKVSCDL